MYELAPPSEWRYRDGWRYAGVKIGWVDADGEWYAPLRRPRLRRGGQNRVIQTRPTEV